MRKRPSGFSCGSPRSPSSGSRCVAYTLLVAKDIGIGDFFFYHGQANLLAEGKGFIHPLLHLDGITVPSAEHPPLWPVVLSVTSSSESTGFEPPRDGLLIGAVAIVIVGLLGRRAEGERTGLLAAGIAAAYPTLIAADGSLMSETLYGVLVEAGLLAALRLLDRPSLPMALALGALIGLAALTRARGAALPCAAGAPRMPARPPRRRAGGCGCWRPAPLL